MYVINSYFDCDKRAIKKVRKYVVIGASGRVIFKHAIYLCTYVKNMNRKLDIIIKMQYFDLVGDFIVLYIDNRVERGEKVAKYPKFTGRMSRDAKRYNGRTLELGAMERRAIEHI